MKKQIIALLLTVAAAFGQKVEVIDSAGVKRAVTMSGATTINSSGVTSLSSSAAVISLTGTANQVAVSGATGTVTLSIPSGRGLARTGLADGAAVLAATPDYDGQLLISTDEYIGVARGTTAGAVNKFAIVGNGQTFILQDTQFSSATVYIDRQLQAGYAGGNYEHWLKNAGADNVYNVQNTSASYYSGAAYITSDGYKVAALAMANGSSAATLVDKFFMHGNTHGAGRFASIPPIVELGQDFDYSGGGFVGHGFIQCIGGNGGLFGTAIWGLHATNSTGSIGLWVNADARVGVGTQTLTTGAELTLNGEVAGGNGAVGTPTFSFSNDPDCGWYRVGTNNIAASVNGVKILDLASGTPPTVTITGQLIAAGSDGAVIFRSNAGGNGGQIYAPDNDRLQLRSAVNGEVWSYSNATSNTNFKYSISTEGPVTLGSGGNQFQKIVSATTTWDPGSLANGASEKKSSVTLTGVAVGDVVTAALTTIVVADWAVQACVTATNTVEVKITNNTGGVVDLGSGTLRINCIKF